MTKRVIPTMAQLNKMQPGDADRVLNQIESELTEALSGPVSALSLPNGRKNILAALRRLRKLRDEYQNA